YATGKTNLSVNTAMNIKAQGKPVCVIVLDIVNPYFRTADFKKLFEENNIKLVAPEYANSNLDIPALSFDLEQLAMSDNYLVIDVGGDDAGATALGRYSQALEKFHDDIEMIYVINAYRYLTPTPDDALELMYEIENASHMKHTAIVNNSNLGSETTPETIENSFEFAEEISLKAELPILFNACREDLAEFIEDKNLMPIKVYVKPFWER
ncbi:MAG: cobalamin biosynthesis protein CobQ, partial [Ruminococcus sp.]